MIRLIREGNYGDYFDQLLKFVNKNRNAIEQIFESCGYLDTDFEPYISSDEGCVYFDIYDYEEEGNSNRLNSKISRFFRDLGFNSNILTFTERQGNGEEVQVVRTYISEN